MLESHTRPATNVRSNCPECDAGLKVLSIISGRAGSEYWTMRCTKCGGIHLDIVKGSSTSPLPSPSVA
jgi:Zn finger protein HypA/HybF involved in hydrogenase expression